MSSNTTPNYQEITTPNLVIYTLGYDHINLLGRYTFSLSEEIRQGAFRPLRELEEAEQEEDLEVSNASALKEA